MIKRYLVALAALFYVLGTGVQAQAQSLLRDAEIETLLWDYSTPIFEAAGVPVDSIDIYLVGNNTPNAFVAGGLNMFIHTGLLTAADTPNQIEGVIAHETGHMAGGHLARFGDGMRAATAPILLTLGLGILAAAAGAPEAGIAIIGQGQVAAQLEFLEYNRAQENAADQAAVTYLETAGLSGQGLVEFFAKLRNQQVIRARRPQSYAQSHPLAGARVSAVQGRIQESPFYELKDDEAAVRRLQMAQAKIYGFLESPAQTFRRFPENDTPMARYARSIAHFRASDLTPALEGIDSLIAEEPDNPYFHELKGQMLFEHGRTFESIEPHRRSVEIAPNEPLLRINLARAMIAAERPDLVRPAIDELKVAVRFEPGNGFAWSELARAYDALGETGLAELATAEAMYAAGDRRGAFTFAQRARQDLRRGTPEWRQAVDIMAATQPQGRERERWSTE